MPVRAADLVMNTDKNTLLIVDDSEITRELLKNILSDKFNIIEQDNGSSAIDIIQSKADELAAILLDVSMPGMSGFDVLEAMRKNNISKIPVFMISGEATSNNVEEAAQYNVFEFIKKPFDHTEVLKRITQDLTSNKRLPDNNQLTDVSIAETRRYIQHLEKVYNLYLDNFGKNKRHYERMTQIMKILLNRYTSVSKQIKLEPIHIELISKAVYFCNIGDMGVLKVFRTDNKQSKDTYMDHTLVGADIIKLNYSENCRYFVQICSDICAQHHEKNDGTGFPYKLSGDKISIYAQMCQIIEDFDKLYYEYTEHTQLRFDYTLNKIIQDTRAINYEVCNLFKGCKYEIIEYYQKFHSALPILCEG